MTATTSIEDARWSYKYRLNEQYPDRCASCRYIDRSAGGRPNGGDCELLAIAVANVFSSRCPRWEAKGPGNQEEEA